MLMAVQMKGHVQHLAWVHRVVPGVLVAVSLNTLDIFQTGVMSRRW